MKLRSILKRTENCNYRIFIDEVSSYDEPEFEGHGIDIPWIYTDMKIRDIDGIYPFEKNGEGWLRITLVDED